MQIKLKWVNSNTLPTLTRIYRNESIKPNDQLGEPIVELEGSVTEWVDTSVTRGKTYYYVFGVVTDVQVLYSAPLKVDAVYRTGPGPSTFLRGDQSLGYYGSVSSLDFMTSSEFLERVNYNTTPTNALPVWDKWSRNGKILFVPRQLITEALSWQLIYNLGCVFGTNDDGPWRPVGAAPKNQQTIITKGFDRFIVRLMTGADDRNNPSRVVADAASVGVRRFSEAADLIYPLINEGVPSSQRFPRLSMISSSFNAITGGRQVLCQEKYKTGCLVAHSSTATTGATIEALSEYPTTNSRAWKPVLELVQSDFVIGEIVL